MKSNSSFSNIKKKIANPLRRKLERKTRGGGEKNKTAYAPIQKHESRVQMKYVLKILNQTKYVSTELFEIFFRQTLKNKKLKFDIGP